jgi:dihydrodipicolinate synthase/N-acetylneuraminate lyase
MAVRGISRTDQLVGIVGALRTFTHDEYTPNYAKQEFHLDWVIRQGITTGNACIMAAAGGSEGYFMSDQEWEDEVRLAASVADGRVPIIAGVFELSAREALKKAEFAAKAGADFVQVAPPHYMVPTHREVIEHFRLINDNVDIGIFAYNTPWAMPHPGYDFGEPVFRAFVELPNVVGVKWSSNDQKFALTMYRLFADKLNFIDNDMPSALSLPAKLGAKGFVNSDMLVAPRFALHEWSLFRERRYTELDDLLLRTYVDPFLGLAEPEDITWSSMGEGPHARAGMETLGLKMGPAFPAQQPLSADTHRRVREGFRRSGIPGWVDWKESLWEEHQRAAAEPAMAAR